MSFEGIQIPYSLSLDVDQLPILSSVANDYGETIGVYIDKSFGIVSKLGEIVAKSSFSPDLTQGFYNSTESFVDLLDISANLRKLQGPADGSFDESTKVHGSNGIKFPIKLCHKSEMQAAIAYYNTDLATLFSFSWILRNTISQHQVKGMPYIYSFNEGEWHEEDFNL